MERSVNELHLIVSAKSWIVPPLGIGREQEARPMGRWFKMVLENLPLGKVGSIVKAERAKL